MKLFDKNIKLFLNKNMYNKSVLKKTKQGEKNYKLLFKKIKKKPINLLKITILKCSQKREEYL